MLGNDWKFDEDSDIFLCENTGSCSLKVESNKDVKCAPEPVAETKISRMDLNTTKAGMEGLDRAKINQIIHEASQGSRFYENEKKKEKQVEKRIEELEKKMLLFTDAQRSKAREEADKIIDELERGRDLSRTIVHVDMDAFYAAVEMRDNPSLKSKPMAVGGTAMLCTSNYLARRFGVRAGMPGFIAKKLCPHLVIVPTNFEKYTKISHVIREVLAHYDPNFLPMSLDEAYLDITGYLMKRKRDERKVKGVGEGDKAEDKVGEFYVKESVVSQEIVDEGVEEIVREIRLKIEEKTQLTASAGISPNMFLAKVCSDKNKPNGQFYLRPRKDDILEFVRQLPLRKAFGIGRVSEQILTSVLKVRTCYELYEKRDLMQLLFTPTACRNYWEISLGLGSTIVNVDRERKSMSTETTFRELNKPEEHFSKCRELCQELSDSLKEKSLMARKIGIKLKTVDFEVRTKICTPSFPVQETEDIFTNAKKLLVSEIRACSPRPLRLRLMGVRAAELSSARENTGESKQQTITSLLKRNGISFPPSRTANMSETAEASKKNSNLNSEEVQSVKRSEVTELNTNTIHSSFAQSSDKVDQEKESKCQLVKDITFEKDRTSFRCPVCEKHLKFSSSSALQKFNSHVDHCLNTQAITDILKKDSVHHSNREPETKKRKRKSSDKTEKRRPLDRFLTRMEK